jgi:hypothetical protein
MSDYLPEMWSTVKEYVSTKDRQTAADHIVAHLVDMGIDDEELTDLREVDTYMENAVSEHVGEEEEFFEEDGEYE